MSFETTLTELRRALRRSRLRAEILLALLSLTSLYLADLVRLTGAEPQNVRGALFGDGKDYRYDHALLALGVVATRIEKGEVAFELTPQGRTVALELQRALLAKLAQTPTVRT